MNGLKVEGFYSLGVKPYSYSHAHNPMNYIVITVKFVSLITHSSCAVTFNIYKLQLHYNKTTDRFRQLSEPR